MSNHIIGGNKCVCEVCFEIRAIADDQLKQSLMKAADDKEMARFDALETLQAVVTYGHMNKIDKSYVTMGFNCPKCRQSRTVTTNVNIVTSFRIKNSVYLETRNAAIKPYYECHNCCKVSLYTGDNNVVVSPLTPLPQKKEGMTEIVAIEEDSRINESN